MRPNSTPLPGITPSDRTVTIAGIEGIPPNTRVNAFQWFLHRDPNVWDQPAQWIPERWLSGEEKVQSKPAGVLWAFGSGPRMCVGSNLTQYCMSLSISCPNHANCLVMRYVLAAIYCNFRTFAVDDGTFGRHAPGSFEDRLMVRSERL